MLDGNYLKHSIEARISSLNFANRQPANLYQPIDYILGLKGKRIRPVLTMLAYEAVSKASPDKALDLAIAVELFHNFTLMHDDIMDRAPVRRGKPTAHIVWDENTAILSGDALFAVSVELVAGAFPDKAARLIADFARVSLEVCEGQMEDMDLAVKERVMIKDYLEMIRKKTAALLGGCMSLGAVAGGADEKLAEQFRAFGENLGIGFQLQDDLMDAFPPENFGKQVGGDIIENKKTYLLLKAIDLAGPAEMARLAANMEESDPQKKVTVMLDLYRELEIPQLTQQLIRQYFDKARQFGQELAQLTQFESLQAYLETIFDRKL